VFQNNEGVQKIRIEFQTQVKKLANESILISSNALKVNTQVSKEVTTVEKKSDSVNTNIGSLTINTEDNTLCFNDSDDPILLKKISDEESIISGNKFILIC